MSNAISDIEETLIELLRADMSEISIKPEEIQLLSPSDAAGKDVRLTLYLYSVIESPSLKNEPMQFVTAKEAKRPPLFLDLYFMLTCHPKLGESDLDKRSQEDRQVLGRAMRVFYDNGILKGSLLKGKLTDTIEELRLSLNPINLEDLTRIWSVFPDTPYRTSVSYLVTPTRVESLRTAGSQRVVSKDARYSEMISNRKES